MCNTQYVATDVGCSSAFNNMEAHIYMAVDTFPFFFLQIIALWCHASCLICLVEIYCKPSDSKGNFWGEMNAFFWKYFLIIPFILCVCLCSFSNTNYSSVIQFCVVNNWINLELMRVISVLQKVRGCALFHVCAGKSLDLVISPLCLPH